jgi:hypothetical protein
VALAAYTFGFRHHFERAGGFARPQTQTAVFSKRQAILHKNVVVVRQEYDVPGFCMIDTVGFHRQYVEGWEWGGSSLFRLLQGV